MNDANLVSNSLQGKRVDWQIGHGGTMANTIVNGHSIENLARLEQYINLNLNLQSQDNFSITTSEEQHEHQTNHDSWGGNIGRAALGGAITGLATTAGLKGGDYLGHLAGNALGNITSGTTGDVLSQAITEAINSGVLSYTTTVGNTMSHTIMAGGSFGDILHSGFQSMTDQDILQSVVISGLTSGLTVGLTQYLDQSFNGIISRGNTTLNPHATLTQQFLSALYESTISTTTSTAIQSAMNGDDFTEAFQQQLLNSLVMAGANLGAKQIGTAYHTNSFSDNSAFNKATQLTLHALLGATANAMTNDDPFSGAVSGVVGEVFAELLANKLYDTTNGNKLTQEQKTLLKEYGGLAGGLASLVTGKLQGLDNRDITNNIYSGQRLGKNAVENNLVYQVARDLKGSPAGKHTFIIAEPDTPEDFTIERLIEEGINQTAIDPEKRVTFNDLGNGKIAIIIGGFSDSNARNNADGNDHLVAEFNKKVDTDTMKDHYNGVNTNIEMVEIRPRDGISDTQFIYNIVQNTQNYQNNTLINPLPYSLNPAYSRNDGYNCNSFSNGLLQASGSSQTEPHDFNGIDWGKHNQVPINNFQNVHERIRQIYVFYSNLGK